MIDIEKNQLFLYTFHNTQIFIYLYSTHIVFIHQSICQSLAFIDPSFYMTRRASWGSSWAARHHVTLARDIIYFNYIKLIWFLLYYIFLSMAVVYNISFFIIIIIFLCFFLKISLFVNFFFWMMLRSIKSSY